MTKFFVFYQQKFEDLRAENIRLNQQVESSVLEARRQVDSQKEKALVKVKTMNYPDGADTFSVFCFTRRLLSQQDEFQKWKLLSWIF